MNPFSLPGPQLLKKAVRLTTLVVAFILLNTGCAILTPDVAYRDSYILRARYEQGACFGRCPVYKLSLYDNGLLIFEGERFTDKEGTWQKVLGRAQTDDLMAEFEAADFAGYPKTFPSNVADMATKKMLYYHKPSRSTFTTSWKESSTPKLEALASRMRQLAESQGYKFASDTIRKYSNILGTNRQVATQELIVQLTDEVNPEAWVIKFNRMNLRYKSKLSPNGNYYLFEADPNRMPINEQLDLIRRDEQVLGAQTNKEVSPRGQ